MAADCLEDQTGGSCRHFRDLGNSSRSFLVLLSISGLFHISESFGRSADDGCYGRRAVLYACGGMAARHSGSGRLDVQGGSLDL